MSKYFLRDCVSFTPGINPSRVQISNLEFYDQNDFVSDYNFEEAEKASVGTEDFLRVKEGDVVISVVMRQAAIVSKGNDGKILTLNFIKVDFDNDFLDKKYFLYLFNSYSGVKRQKERMLQGTGAVLKIPVKSLNDIEIPVISMLEQMKIGEAYKKTVCLNNYLDKYKCLMGKCVNSILEESVKGRRK
ncbi:MAG: restriction endonuclease subunit S [Bacillota bacterium]|nr:restriction endonuclease subunit S [Bacillota bacterium]